MVKIKGIEDHPIYFSTSAGILKLAGELRKNMTEAENLLWARIRKRQLDGYKFRRQHPIYMFIADFYCHDLRLVIEVDGSIHNEPAQKERDKEREYMMEQLGIKTIRFTNAEIENDVESVLRRIRESILSIPNL